MSSTKVRSVGSTVLPLYCSTWCGLAGLAAFAAMTASLYVYCTENIASCAVTLSRASPCFPYPPVSTVKSEYHRRSVVQVFEQPADHPWHSLSECLDDGMMLKTGKGRFGVTEVIGTAPFGSPASGHAQPNNQACFFSPSTLDVSKTPRWCEILDVMSV